MRTSEVLNKAADLIGERGHGTGNEAMCPSGGPLCLEGGIGTALGIEASFPYRGRPIIPSRCVRRSDAGRAVAEYLGDRLFTDAAMPFGVGSLWGWNDRDGRTASEVIEVLRATALIEAAHEDAALLAEAGRA